MLLMLAPGCGGGGAGPADVPADADVPVADGHDAEVMDPDVPGGDADLQDADAQHADVPEADGDGQDAELQDGDVPEADADAPEADVPEADADVPGADADLPVADGQDADAASTGGRLVAAGRAGRMASLDLAAPWTVRASVDLAARIESVRCLGDRCVVVLPSPGDAIVVVDARDLSVRDTIPLEKGADPRDVALVDDRTILVSQFNRASLARVDPVTRTVTSLDLAALADADGLPEAHRLANCGRKVYAQLLRVAHDTGVPAGIPAVIAVVDLDRPDGEALVDVDPDTPGVQGIVLAGRPDFDMPIDCAAGILSVAEPKPLMQGGGGYEQVDLGTNVASDLPIDTGAQVGGFEIVDAGRHWLITHTEYGPGPSSHLNLFGGEVSDTYNTFADEHVDDLALDREPGLLYFPDPCNPEKWEGCDGGIQVFHAFSGVRATAQAMKLDFAPVEVAVAR